MVNRINVLKYLKCRYPEIKTNKRLFLWIYKKLQKIAKDDRILQGRKI